jgi:pimeloyl-ACP methyl ester carboxylesterase
MKHLRVNGHDMAYADFGSGKTVVCIHGSLGDFRVWSAQFGPLSEKFRVDSVSLRHFFPNRWDGDRATYKMDQHVADVIAFIEALGVGRVHLMGHSRGGHISFRVAQARPDLVDRIVLAEPGGDLDASLRPAGNEAPPMRANVLAVSGKIEAGDVDGGLKDFIDRLEGDGAWERMSPVARQELRDNAPTMIAQTDEQRRPFSLADAQAVRAPALFVIGGATPGNLPVVARVLAQHVREAKTVVIPGTTHFMFEQEPVIYNKAVLDFLGAA